MKKLLIILALAAAAFASGYICGQALTKVKVANKKAEVIKNAAHKKALIHSEPNASRDELLELMRNGEL